MSFSSFLNKSVLKPSVGTEQASSAAGMGEATVAQSEVLEFKQSEEGGPVREGMAADMGDWLYTKTLIDLIIYSSKIKSAYYGITKLFLSCFYSCLLT